MPDEADRVLNIQLLIVLCGIALTFIGDDPLRKHLAFLVAQSHKHGIPVFKVLFHPLLDGELPLHGEEVLLSEV